MATGELSKRRGDELAELRERYNQLCAALTLSAGTNPAAAERLLQELQALAQMIMARQGEREAAGMAPRPEGGPAAAAPRGTNVVAFRFKVRGGAYENPRLPTALNDLATRGRLAADVGAVERRRFPVSAEPAAAAVSQPLRAAIAGQGAEIERLARSNEEQRQLLERLDQRLTAGPTTPDLATDLAALRAATARHGQQLVSLAIAVHRLAKLLAAETTPGRR